MGSQFAIPRMTSTSKMDSTRACIEKKPDMPIRTAMLTPLPLDIVGRQRVSSRLDPDWNREAVQGMHVPSASTRELLVCGYAIKLLRELNARAVRRTVCELFAHRQTTYSCFQKLFYPRQSSLLQARDKTSTIKIKHNKGIQPCRPHGGNCKKDKKHKSCVNNSASPSTRRTSTPSACAWWRW